MNSRVWTALLEWAARRLDTPDLPGDLWELHARRAERTGLRAADRWYRRQIRMAVWRALWIRGSDGGAPGGSGRRSVASRVTAIVRETHLALRRVRRRPVAALTFAFVVGTGITVVAFMVQTRADILDPARRLALEAELVAWVSDEGEASTRVALRGSEAWLADPPAAVEAVAESWNRRTRIESPGGLIRTSGERVLTGHLGRFEASAWIGRDAVRPGEVVLEHGFWRSRFEADADMAGRNVLFDGEPVRVVGVAPPGWAGPHCCVPPSF